MNKSNINVFVFFLMFFTCTWSNACTTDEAEKEGIANNPFFIGQDSLSNKGNRHEQDQEQNELDDSIIIVAHWNIGHFSQGKSSDTFITAQETDSLRELYLNMINSMDSDIMGICEYNPTFNTKGDNTAQLLFSSFPYCYIGKKYDYNCNSFFSRFPLYSCTQYSFPKCVQARYFSVASFTMKGNTIKFVETHLDFNQGSNGSSYRSSQMKELIDAFKDYPYVIICADFNSRIRDEYNIFLDAGFSLATDNLPNAGSPSTDTSQIIIDNIIVKGFRVKETKVYPHMSLSDHDLIWSRLVITD